jgi:hypothetical protein
MAEDGGQATITATLSQVSYQNVTVTLAFADTAGKDVDYTASADQIVVLAGNLTGTVVLTATDDTTAESDETIQVSVDSVVNGTASGTVAVTATIQDNDDGNLAGDDDVVDFTDLTYFIGAYGTEAGDDGYDARADFDGDGDIDFNDLTVFISLYGTDYGDGGRDAVGRSVRGSVLAEVILEGPVDPVAVGQSFDVRVYVVEYSLTAAGFRGGPIDVAFSGSTVQVADGFAPAQVIQPPFASLFPNGTVQENLIDELGGVTFLDGYGDGVPVLYAVIPFVAQAAGEAVIAVQPGSIGLALSGQLAEVANVDYGDALVVQVTGDAADFANDLRVSLDGNPQITLKFGAGAEANDDYADADGDYLAPPLMNGGEACFVTASGQHLAHDIRALDTDMEWPLLLSLPQAGTWTLAWDEVLALPDGYYATITPVDADWHPDGDAVVMTDTTSLTVVDTTGRGAMRFMIRVSTGVHVTLELAAGWNLVSVPVTLDIESQVRFLGHGHLLAFWAWDPALGYYVPDEILPTCGYWVYSMTALSLDLSGAPVADSSVELELGWNLVGPVAALPSPALDGTVDSCWGYTPGVGYRSPSGSCQPGNGYWMYTSVDGVIIWSQR